MELDGRRRAVGGRATFDDVRVERPLGEIPRPLDPCGLLGEAFDEGLPDAASLLLRLGDPGEHPEEFLLGADDVEVGLEVGGEFLDHRHGFVLPQQAVVDEDA